MSDSDSTPRPESESESEIAEAESEEETRQRHQITFLHRCLGALTVFVFLGGFIIDMLPGYSTSPYLSALVMIAFLTFLGFGHLTGGALKQLR